MLAATLRCLNLICAMSTRGQPVEAELWDSNDERAPKPSDMHPCGSLPDEVCQSFRAQKSFCLLQLVSVAVSLLARGCEPGIITPRFLNILEQPGRPARPGQAPESVGRYGERRLKLF